MIITKLIYDNWRAKRRFNSGNFSDSCGSTLENKSLSESLNYINNVFEDYLIYSSNTMDNFRGKRILEIGPGDNLGVALKFLVAGAAQVVCLDKFYSKRKFEQEYELYQALRAQLDENSKKLFDEAINLKNGIEINSNKLKYIYGISINEARNLFNKESFDFIISRAVLEHIYDIDTAFSVMNDFLVSGGYMMHKIDLQDHKIFSSGEMHPLTFLTIPDFLYRLISKYTSHPNRKLIKYYRQKMIELGYDTKIFITSVVGEEGEILPHKEAISFNVDFFQHTLNLIDKIRQKLSSRFRNISNKSLMISGIFLIAKKPK